MHSALFTLFGFATAAYSASIPRAELKSFEVTGLNFTQAAGSDAANVTFWLNDPNTNSETICSHESARPNELHFCNGTPQFVFGQDFKTLAVSFLYIPDGFQGHTALSGTSDVNLVCVVHDTTDNSKECQAEGFKIEPTVVAP